MYANMTDQGVGISIDLLIAAHILLAKILSFSSLLIKKNNFDYKT